VETTLFRRMPKDFKVDLVELESLVTPRTKLLVLSNLHNPSSTFLQDETLQGIATLAQKFKIKVLMDEIFHDFVEEKQPPAATLNDCFISLNSLSKVYGLSLLRCGWILASPEVIENIRPVQVIVENIGSRLTQTLASIVLEHSHDYREYWSQHLSKNREIVQEGIRLAHRRRSSRRMHLLSENCWRC
jgi:aspartate/methionine/tyrosine aminotransferase